MNNLECTIQKEATGIISHPEWLISKEIPDKKVYSIGESLKMCFRVMGYNKIYLTVIEFFEILFIYCSPIIY